ncbi:FAD-dependent oxidoreductase [Catenuloplanes atrovinosus]|uniref:2-polyprenyl-6-methoxyphenol hydroxylase-like FAD-dependent oxidoreductase n=1 Tax=Catenuloplanes atrovinosus TaxID=137266 RepID=A0AAE4CD06_9ACTN|nr:FAD-dependent oxidoreductase [Catenuloplanes atrovinosus]MDR7277050.1 2-polyprenyl-6-methoxyphenol hydroxylase-like FAD-dependent oxidoreductase [Catenuloplanes atrovinosus]
MATGDRARSAAARFAGIASAAAPAGPRTPLGRAVVLGGSIAGLMAARVLSEHAREVLIVERDDLDALNVSDARMAADPDAVGSRPGVPQSGQLHALLPAGQVQLGRWFPGFAEQAWAAGAVNPPRTAVRLHLNGRLNRTVPPEPGAEGTFASRAFLEALIRNRVLGLPNVRARHGRADGLLLHGDAVTGVRVRPDGGGAVADERADLVVDCTGRSSRINDWLEAYGYPRAPMRRIGIKLNYATARIPRPAGPDVWIATSVVTPGPGRTARLGFFTPIEHDRWSLLVAGYGDDRPGRDPADFLRRVRSLPPEFGAAVGDPGEVGEIATYHQADSRRRDFHLLDRFPARLLVAGDAVASLNPAYGHGMSAAMLHASCLSAYLRSGPDLTRPARSYFADVALVVDAAWQNSAMIDVALPHVDGPYPRGYRAAAWFSDRVVEAARRDPRINREVSLVSSLLAHPAALSRPSFLLRVLTA